ncbi:hypothetical protein BJ912DRAFT_969655 [Pholiota molesta]|nr:hypothetical protein BJ912DRAFT_969655 [Pholiota molesta]
MRYFSICTLFFCIFSLAAAIPVPGPMTANRPHTPTPEDDPSVPLPGRTGTHTDARTGVVTLHYGDDHLHEHMGHLQRNQAAFPHNRNPNPLSGHAERNRDHALHNIPTAGNHPVTGLPRVRDEKLLNMLHNPHHATSTTVEYLPDRESRWSHFGLQSSDRESRPEWTGTATPQPRLAPSPPRPTTWPRSPRALEHPTPRRRDAAPKKAAAKPKSDKHTPGASTATESYTPSAVGANKMGLRERKGKPAPPPAPPKVDRPAHAAGTSNLRPGRVAPPGHVWHPATGGARASHSGAPGHLKEAAQRHPPRPQNHAHHMKQLHAGKEAEAKHTAAAAAPAAHTGASKYQPAQTANLRAFEQRHPARRGGAAGRAREAPARMQTHVNHTPAHSRPSSAQGHHVRPASPHPQTLPHHPKPKGGPSGKKK